MIFTEIFKNLDLEDVLRASMVCKEWLSISRNDVIWKNLFQKDFIEILNVKSKKNYQKLRPRHFTFANDYFKAIFLKKYKFKGQSPIYKEYAEVYKQLKSLEEDQHQEDMNTDCEIACSPRLTAKEEMEEFYNYVKKLN